MLPCPEPDENGRRAGWLHILIIAALVGVCLWLGVLTVHDLFAGAALTVVRGVWRTRKPSEPDSGSQADE
jgi:hypothetical protein